MLYVRERGLKEHNVSGTSQRILNQEMEANVRISLGGLLSLKGAVTCLWILVPLPSVTPVEQLTLPFSRITLWRLATIPAFWGFAQKSLPVGRLLVVDRVCTLVVQAIQMRGV